MLNLKNIYNSLNVLELTNFCNINFFFIFKDSFNTFYHLNFLNQEILKKLVSKSVFKNITISDFTKIKSIKFPLNIYSFNFHNFFEEIFLNFFSTNLKFLFFKLKTKIFYANSFSYILSFNFFILLKYFNFLLNNFFNFLFFRILFKSKISKI